MVWFLKILSTIICKKKNPCTVDLFRINSLVLWVERPIRDFKNIYISKYFLILKNIKI